MAERGDCTCDLKDKATQAGAIPPQTSVTECPYHGPLYRDTGHNLAALRSDLKNLEARGVGDD